MSCKDKFMGQAKHRIDIQSYSVTDDTYGGSSGSWTSVGLYWAMIEPMSGREVFASEQNQSRLTHRITIRYQSAFANTKNFATYRIVFNSRYFNIKYIRNLDTTLKFEGKDFQIIEAEENASIHD